MVVFTCGHCGESVQKPKVEKHYMTKCRNRNPNLSCMDCFKDFYGQEYDEHTKCVTEQQRYSAKGFVAKTPKGEQKQSAWVDLVQSVLEEQHNAPAQVIRIIEAVSKHSNTPRKKPKFINFVKNVCGNRTSQQDVEQAWNLISIKLEQLKLNNTKNSSEKPEIVENRNEVENGKKESEEKPETESESKLEGNEDNLKIENETNDGVSEQVKSKKQLKAEKKKQKYEMELKKASEKMPEETVEEEEKNTKRPRNNTECSETEIATIGKTKKKKSKKSEEEPTLHDENVNSEETPQTQPEKFNWNEFIIDSLRKKGNEMPLNRLQKKILAAYSEVTGKEITDRIMEKLGKSILAAPNVKLIKDKVVLRD